MGDFQTFIKAVKDGNFEEARNSFQPEFLEKATGDWKLRPIHYASWSGHLEIVRFLLQNKCSLECEDERKWQPIHLACQNGHLEVVKLLLQNKCSLECEDQWKKRSIHFACQNGHLEVVKFLLQNKCSLECEDERKQRPIHFACQNRHLEVVKFLLQNKCSLECEDERKQRPIHFACQNRHLEVVKFLLQNNCSLECEDKNKQRPIHFACQNRHLEVVKLLLQNKCSLECEDKIKRRPIHLACLKGHLEVVKFLLQNKCSPECEDEWKHRPIHLACQNGHLEVVKFLLQNKCSLECEDERKKRPIHFACQNGHLEVVKFLLQNKCSLECEDEDKQRPIHYACQNGHLEVVKVLIQSNCLLDCRTKDGKTPLELAKENGRKACENILKEILVARRKVYDCVRRNDARALGALYSTANLVIEQLKTGFSILEAALQSNANEIIDYFLNKPVDAEELSALENYIRNCPRPEAVQLMEECLLYRSIRFHDADGFHLTCSAKTINEHGKLVKTSFLEVAAEFGCKPFIQSLLKKSVYNEEEWTKAKDLTILKGQDEIAEAISKRKHLLRKRADKGFTWLHSAVCDNDPDMVKYILEGDLVNPDFNNEVVGTCLALAHMMCYGDCIEVLERFNVDVNTKNTYSQSPLHEAIASGMTDHCSYLISRVQDIDKPGFMGFTGLQCAVIKGCKNLCVQLVKNGADCVRYVEIPQQSPINKSAVLPISKRENATTLCLKIHKTIYPCFLKVLDLWTMECSDGDGNSLLHLAVKTIQPELCNALIKSGSSVEAVNNQRHSPLLELFTNVGHRQESDNIQKAIETLDVLIDSGADINKVSNSGTNVFQMASRWNSERLMLSLLSKQPKVTCLTEADFKLAFMKHWFGYATVLINVTAGDFLQSSITHEIFQLIMVHADPTLLMSLFVKSNPEVQQSVIEDLLDHFALTDKYDEFSSLINTEIVKPKLLENGETILTSLLKKKHLKYCWALINCEINRKFIGMANEINQTPLQIAIELELIDLMNPLIFNCDDLSNVEFNWHAPLIPLFQKLSISTNNDVDQKLLAAIKAIVCKGGDIYKETFGGSAIINCCTRFRESIETFQNNERFKERGDKNICSICLDKKVDCVFLCGHTFCMECANQLCRCAICNLEVSKPIKLFLS